MSTLYLLIPLSLAMGALFWGAFLWGVKSGQFDDLDSPSQRMLIETKPRADDKHDTDNQQDLQLNNERTETV